MNSKRLRLFAGFAIAIAIIGGYLGGAHLQSVDLLSSIGHMVGRDSQVNQIVGNISEIRQYRKVNVSDSPDLPAHSVHYLSVHGSKGNVSVQVKVDKRTGEVGAVAVLR